MLLRQWILAGLVGSGLLQITDHGPWATPLDRLFLPETPWRSLDTGKRPVYIQISSWSCDAVLQYYLRLLEGGDWQLIFPSRLEAEVWLQAQQKTGQPPVYWLSLKHRKTKFNAHLTIGALHETSAHKGRTIITIYTSSEPFGRVGR